MKIYNYISKVTVDYISIILLIWLVGFEHIANLFNFKLIFFPISKSFSIDNAHLRIIFIFLFAVSSIVLLESSLKVTSKCQCIISIFQCSLTAFENSSISGDKLLNEVIVTNIDYLTPEEIFHEYNQRCDIENNIDELKEGFAFGENSLLQHKMNELYLLIKMIAYNIHNWFKKAVMPKDVQHHEISTLRRIFYKLSGNINGNGYYKHLSFSKNNKLNKIICFINDSIILFANKIYKPDC